MRPPMLAKGLPPPPPACGREEEGRGRAWPPAARRRAAAWAPPPPPPAPSSHSPPCCRQTGRAVRSHEGGRGARGWGVRGVSARAAAIGARARQGGAWVSTRDRRRVRRRSPPPPPPPVAPPSSRRRGRRWRLTTLTNTPGERGAAGEGRGAHGEGGVGESARRRLVTPSLLAPRPPTPLPTHHGPPARRRRHPGRARLHRGVGAGAHAHAARVPGER